MTRLFDPPVPITVDTDAAGAPSHFHWLARQHRIAGVVQSWQVDTDWWTPDGRAARTYYAVTTQGGLLCVLYHDHLGNAWFLSRAYD